MRLENRHSSSSPTGLCHQAQGSENPGNGRVVVHSLSENHNVVPSIARNPRTEPRCGSPVIESPGLPAIPRVLLREPWAGRRKAVGLRKNTAGGTLGYQGQSITDRSLLSGGGQNDIHFQNRCRIRGSHPPAARYCGMLARPDDPMRQSYLAECINASDMIKRFGRFGNPIFAFRPPI